MTVSHHLLDETLQDFSAGVLSFSMETLVACHLSQCSRCRSRARQADAIGGHALDRCEPASVAGTAAAVLRQAAETGDAPRAVSVERSTGVIDLPAPLARLLPKPVDELDWRRVAPGIRQYNLTDQHRSQGAFKLLHLAPGVVLSQHAHNDRELTYVVKGSYLDEMGRFRAGDIADLDAHDVHQPVVDTDEPCIALIATHSPVRFSGMFARIMQPFVGI